MKRDVALRFAVHKHSPDWPLKLMSSQIYWTYRPTTVRDVVSIKTRILLAFARLWKLLSLMFIIHSRAVTICPLFAIHACCGLYFRHLSETFKVSRCIIVCVCIGKFISQTSECVREWVNVRLMSGVCSLSARVSEDNHNAGASCVCLSGLLPKVHGSVVEIHTHTRRVAPGRKVVQ